MGGTGSTGGAGSGSMGGTGSGPMGGAGSGSMGGRSGSGSSGGKGSTGGTPGSKGGVVVAVRSMPCKLVHPCGCTSRGRRTLQPMAEHALPASSLRLMGGAMLAAGAALPFLPGDTLLVCPLRAITGIPCPLCGMTTSVTATLQLELGDALSANPVGVLLVVVALALLVTRPSRLPVASWWVLAAEVAFSWLWQLQRFSVI